MPMPKTNAPMISDGPIGAIAPPKPGTSAATGTMTVAATAISSNAAINPPASPPTRKRRHTERETADDQRSRRRLSVEPHQRDQNRGAEHRGDQERPVEPRQLRGRSERSPAHEFNLKGSGT